MRYLAVILILLSTDRASDRSALLAADRALSARTQAAGVQGFLQSLADSAVFLYPGAPLLRGAPDIRAFVMAADSIGNVSWTPAFADVSSDGTLGYTYGWTRSSGGRGKYLACWRKSAAGWRVIAYARTTPVAVPDSVSPPARRGDPGALVQGRADPSELRRADSSFAALSVAQGAKAAFVSYAAADAVSFGGGAQITEGRDAIGAAFDGFPSGAVLEWWPLGAEIATSGDLGCTVGEARIVSLHHFSKYLTVWQRQADGSWKFVADGGNVRPAPTN
ncbi:MAG TPA: hypothetical protein VIV83_06455 [Gemmatimonadales bacterium]